MNCTSEDVRIHIDWWGKCRTCKHWDGNRWEDFWGKCLNENSPLFCIRRTTDKGIVPSACTSEGYCEKWDTYNMDAAEITMRWDGKGLSPDMIMAQQEKIK